MDFLPGELHVRLPNSDGAAAGGEGDEAKVDIFFFTSELHRMNRDATQAMRSTLTRFGSTWVGKMLPKPSKARSKGGAGAGAGSGGGGGMSANAVTVSIELNGSALDVDSLTNLEWQTGMVLKLQHESAGEFCFNVIVNPPAVVSLQTFPCKSVVSVGLPISPLVVTEFSDAVVFSWHVETGTKTGEFSPAGTGTTFSPEAHHVGCRVKVFATPTDSVRGIKGRAAVCYVSAPVIPTLPAPATLACRAAFIARERDPANPSPCTRVVCWNLLAEPFATSDYSRKVIYTYCHSSCLESEYRLQLVSAELRAYAADCLCLQEVDAKAFTQYLQPVLGEQGYRGWHANKSSSVREGCAFFASPRVTVHGCWEVPIGGLLARRQNLAALFLAKPWVRDVLTTKLGTVAQLALCQRMVPGQDADAEHGPLFIVANTHLFYHPGAPYARLLQTDTIVRAARRLSRAAAAHVQAHGSARGLQHSVTAGSEEEEGGMQDMAIPLLFCGDLNSTPETAVVEYLERGFVAEGHAVWASLDRFRWGKRQGGGEEGDGEEERDGEGAGAGKDEEGGQGERSEDEDKRAHWREGLSDAELSAPPPLPPPCPQVSHALPPTLLSPAGPLTSAAGYPAFTNYTAGFKDLLDYVYVPQRVLVAAVAPFPDEDVLRAHTALPSPLFPSDHLAVVVDLVIT